MDKGFTLVEILVTVSIIAIMTILILPNYRFGNKQLALQRSASKIAQDLRRAQEFAISSKEFGGAVPAGYGVFFDLNEPTSYILFADIDGDSRYAGPSEKVEEISPEAGIEIAALEPMSAESSLTVVFIPPNPTISFFPNASSSLITIEMAGVTAEINQYAYNLDVDAGWSEIMSPNPACDQSADSSCVYWLESTECGLSFSASASDETNVYDRCRWQSFDLSLVYIKEKSQVMGTPQKTIEVNAAGLIAVP